jgi:hypothetical protein
MRVIKRKDAGRYERITGANGARKQRQIRDRIAPGVVLRWWFELHDRRVRCFVKVDATALKDYTLVDVDERTDIISFPVQ